MGVAVGRMRGRALPLWAIACAVAAASLLPASGPAAPEVRAPSLAEGRLWRVSRPGVGDSFVLGTIHVADARVTAIAPPVADALARSRLLALEVAPDVVVDAETMEGETLEGAAGLEALIGNAAFSRLRTELAARGLPEQRVARLKPWAAMVRIAAAAPVAAEGSLDERLYLAARARGMRVTSLESPEEQIAAFDALPLRSQVALLEHALAHRDRLAGALEATIGAWLRGDLDALARIAADTVRPFPGMREHYEQLTKHLIDDRTAVMHHGLYLPLRQGRVFVAVGASHLPGRRGLLALLQQDGYRLTPVW